LGPDAVSWEIQMSDVTVQREIGRGAYGIVYKALWRNQIGTLVDCMNWRLVAVKKILGEGVDEPQINNFMQEIKLMK